MFNNIALVCFVIANQSTISPKHKKIIVVKKHTMKIITQIFQQKLVTKLQTQSPNINKMEAAQQRCKTCKQGKGFWNGGKYNFMLVSCYLKLKNHCVTCTNHHVPTSNVANLHLVTQVEHPLATSSDIVQTLWTLSPTIHLHHHWSWNFQQPSWIHVPTM